MNNIEKNFLRTFGKHIAVRRKSLGLTQCELAKSVEISSAHIASIETGRRWPHLEIIRAIAKAPSTTPFELMCDTTNYTEIAL